MVDRIVRQDLELQVVARDGSVHLLMSARNDKNELVPAQWDNFALSTEHALALAGLIADLAYETDSKLKPAGEGLKAALIERAKAKLENRITVMLNSLREKKRVSNRKLAEDIVTQCLNEVYR